MLPDVPGVARPIAVTEMVQRKAQDVATGGHDFDHIDAEELFSPLGVSRHDELERAHRMLRGTGAFSEVDYFTPMWARVWMIVDTPDEGGHLEAGEPAAAVRVTLHYNAATGDWCVYRIGDDIDVDDLPELPDT